MVEEKKRYVGLDILRVVLILPTIMLHVWNIIFGETHVTFSSEQSLYPFYENVIARLFGYSGIFIFALSFFLYGIKQHSLFKLKPIREYFKLALLIGAMVSTQFSDSMNPSDPDFFMWDIFSFVLVAYLIISFLALIKSERVLQIILAVGISLFFVPVTFYSKNLSGIFHQQFETALFAVKTSVDSNGWFLLPWIGLPLIFYPLGRLFVVQKSFRKWYWLLLLVGVLLAIVASETFPPALGSLFYEYVFWQSPAYIIARLLIFSGLVLWLCQTTWARGWNFFSYLQWNKNFWFCYILHFGFIDFLSDHQSFFAQNLFYLDWLWLGLFLGVELMAQMFFAITKLYIWIGKFVFRIGRRWFRSN